MNESAETTKNRDFVQWFVHLMVILLCVGNAVPGINESHYLPKARHFWDSSFAAGDLFLESYNSHYLASLIAGALTQLFSLVAVAWIGRFACWALLAWVWILFSRAVKIPRILSPFALAAWYFAMNHGHWAGEWAIGGFEAKTVAYPCVLMGVLAAVQDRWRMVWVWMGLAVAWHPIAGGWAGLSVGLLWIGLPDLRSRFPKQLAWIGLGAAIGLLGVAPALLGIGGEDRSGSVVASQVHVYLRLTHHLCPRTFALTRHLAAVVSLLALIGATVYWRSAIRTRSDRRVTNGLFLPLGRLLAIAWISVAFSLVGLLIDALLSGWRPDIASKLLRFYWFRWSDVAVPLAWTTVFWSFVGQYVNPRASWTLQPGRLNTRTDIYGRSLIGLGIVATSLLAVSNVSQNWNNTVPAADRLMLDSVGRHEIETDRYVDWLAVCSWIRNNTPPDSLWFTPKYQQTFKWYAQRAEVVCWKDVPQDNQSVLEWFDRVQRCQPPRDDLQRVREWTTGELIDVCQEFGCEWILLDRTVQKNPPLLEIAYPVNVQNRSFSVFRVANDIDTAR